MHFYPIQTTVSYLQWIMDDLSVAQTCLNRGNVRDEIWAVLIAESVDQIAGAIGSCCAMGFGSERILKVAILKAEDALQIAAHRFSSSECTRDGEVDMKTLVDKSLTALSHIRTSNGWSKVSKT